MFTQSLFNYNQKFFATHGSGSSSGSNRSHDSCSKRRGQKANNAQLVNAGEIIYRQLGNTVHAGDNVYTSKDFTLHAKIFGTVMYFRKGKKRFVKVLPLKAI